MFKWYWWLGCLKKKTEDPKQAVRLKNTLESRPAVIKDSLMKNPYGFLQYATTWYNDVYKHQQAAHMVGNTSRATDARKHTLKFSTLSIKGWRKRTVKYWFLFPSPKRFLNMAGICIHRSSGGWACQLGSLWSGVAS